MTPKQLKREREKRGLSVRKAGPVQKIAWSYLTKLENGQRPICDDRAELIMIRYREYDKQQAKEHA